MGMWWVPVAGLVKLPKGYTDVIKDHNLNLFFLRGSLSLWFGFAVQLLGDGRENYCCFFSKLYCLLYAVMPLVIGLGGF